MEIVVRILDVSRVGDTTRRVRYCGHPWQEHGTFNGHFRKDVPKHTHTGRSDLLSESVACQMLDVMEDSG